MQILYVGEDNLVQWLGMTSSVDGSYINDATVAGVLKRQSGEIVADGITLAYVAGSNGDYRGEIDQSITLVHNARYTLELSAESQSREGFRRIECQAFYHEER